MSNIYVHEPPTNGTVRLITTVGDIDIELWSKEAPKACKNFVQLCLDGYYNNTVFHRLVRGFIVQGGDPNGDGRSHGESIYGKPYNDEFHSRLRFVRRGLVGMANTGPNDNTSHFFFTLAATPELNSKNTIFAKIGGETIYNMLKLTDGETDKNDRPLHLHKIINTKVVDNPFPELVCRKREEKFIEETSTKDNSKSVKNFSLLSFGEEAEQEENETIKINNNVKFKSKSSHDILNDSKLSSTPAVNFHQTEKKTEDEDDDFEDYVVQNEKDPNAALKVRDKMKRKYESNQEMATTKRKKIDDNSRSDAKKYDDDEMRNGGKRPAKYDDLDDIEDEVVIPTTKDKIKELRREANLLRKELKKEKPKDAEVEVTAKKTIQSAAIQEFETEQSKYESIKGARKKGADREATTLALLQKFEGKLHAVGRLNNYEEGAAPDDDENDKSDNDDSSWLSHKLTFVDEEAKTKVKDANLADASRYELFDPRNSMNKRRRKDDKKEKKHRSKR